VDEVSAILHIINDQRIEGPVNAVAPQAVTNHVFTKALAGALHRPGFAAAPAIALKAALGSDLATELLLASQRVEPRALESFGFEFHDPELQPLLRRLVSHA
jgi:NAD dependent epimerase/dehydratase family enzyme